METLAQMESNLKLSWKNYWASSRELNVQAKLLMWRAQVLSNGTCEPDRYSRSHGSTMCSRLFGLNPDNFLGTRARTGSGTNSPYPTNCQHELVILNRFRKLKELHPTRREPTRPPT
jgi:hypothetical protein